MGYESARTDRGSRFPSSGSARGHAAPAADYASADFDPYADFDGFEDDSPMSSMADSLIDGLLPPEVDWRQIVRRHPVPALIVAGLGGYLIGRSQGRSLLKALSALAVARVESGVMGVDGDDED
ncbi:MAG: hypothetical protein ABI639_01245 [Thermoanaerobaculia bacterium]